MLKAKVELDFKEFEKEIIGYDKNSLQVGIFSKKIGLAPDRKKGVKSFNGGQASRTGGNQAKFSTEELAKKFDLNYRWGDNALKNKAVVDVSSDVYYQYLAGNKKDNKLLKRALNGGVAILHSILLKRGLGVNSKKTQEIKGFNWLGVDTGQMYNDVEARISEKQ